MKAFPIKVLAGPIRADEVSPARPAASRLGVELATSGGLLVARIVGELDGGNAADLSRLADDLAAQGAGRVLLDLRQLYSMDTVGLVALIDAEALLRQCGGGLALAEVRPRVRHFLSRMGMSGQFTTFLSVEEAVLAESAAAASASVAAVAEGGPVRSLRAEQALSA